MPPRRQITLPEPWQFPFPIEAGDFRLTMGLRHIDEPEWLLDGPDHHAQMAERRRLLLSDPAAVLACLPEAEAAAGELWRLVAGTGSDARTGTGALAAIGARVQEDFCLLQRDGEADDASYRLTGAVLCFPNRWKLADKLGRSLIGIHQPVPGYGERLGQPVDRFMSALKDGRIVQRHNWSLHADDTLFHPGPGVAAPVDAAAAGRQVFMRVERQTLRRLPVSGAIAFGIRTLIAPLAEAADTGEKRRLLDQALATMPAELLAYKAMTTLVEPIRGWITAHD